MKEPIKMTWRDGMKIMYILLVISCFCFGGTILMYAYVGGDGHTGMALILGITLFTCMLEAQGRLGDFNNEEEDEEIEEKDKEIENLKTAIFYRDMTIKRQSERIEKLLEECTKNDFSEMVRNFLKK